LLSSEKYRVAKLSSGTETVVSFEANAAKGKVSRGFETYEIPLILPHSERSLTLW
jgi:hypothetical protein